jgi:hypothetical protein
VCVSAGHSLLLALPCNVRSVARPSKVRIAAWGIFGDSAPKTSGAMLLDDWFAPYMWEQLGWRDTLETHHGCCKQAITR